VLFRSDWSNAVRLRATLNQFFQITDQSKYPQEKYMDMVNLSVDLKTLEANYENDFTAVKNSNNLNTINKYCQTYPKSAHAEELKPIIASLQAKEQQQEKSQHSAEVRSMYMGTYKKKLSSGIAQTVVAGVFIPAGIGMLAGAGSLEQTYTATDPYTGRTYSGTDVSAEEIVCYTLGALTLTGGIVLGITGPITIKNAMVLKRKMKREEANVSFYPMMQPHLMAFGGGVKIKF